MFCKLTVLLFITVIDARQLSNSESISDPIDDLLERLENDIDRAVSEAKIALENAKHFVNETATKVETVTIHALEGIEKRFQDEIDDLKAEAKDAGVDVDECFGQDETTLLALPEVAVHQTVTCTEGYVFRVFNDIDDALDKIQKITDDVLEMKKDIEKCNDNKICLAQLAIKIEKDITILPAEIARDARDVIDIVRNLESEIQKCGTDAIEQFEASGQRLLKKISQCVIEKIKN